jgi:hypothetical protein
MCQPSRVDTWQTVSFWIENLTDVLIWFFLKIKVSSVMRIETRGLKNKVSKTQEPEVYLTQKLKTKNYKLKKKKEKEIEKSKNQKVSKPPHWPNHQKWP